MQQSVNSSFALSLVQMQRRLTPAKALNSPLVAALNQSDPGGLAEALANLLVFTAQQFNVVRNFTDFQIMTLAAELPARYWHWRIEEFVYVCREGVAGKWGKVLDRLDANVIHAWCQAYAAEEQAQAVADAAEKRAASYKAVQPHLDPMPVLYLRQQIEERYRPDQWLNLQRWVAQNYPGRDDLLTAISDVDAEYTRRKRIEATHKRDQQQKARQMLAFAGQGTPGEKEFAAHTFRVLPALPKGQKLNEREFEYLNDITHTGAEEAA